jgi:hypothetical protein
MNVVVLAITNGLVGAEGRKEGKKERKKKGTRGNE